MAIKVNDFSIQAKVIQTCGDDTSSASEKSGGTTSESISASVRKEIIDECMEKVKEYLEREASRY